MTSIEVGTGTHLLVEFHRCANAALLSDTGLLKACMHRVIRQSGLTPVGDLFHKFEGEGGITGIVLLAESHVAIHTWPERDGFLTMDIFACNMTCDNEPKSQRALDLFREAFRPGTENSRTVYR